MWFVKPLLAGGQGTPLPGQPVLGVRGVGPVSWGFQCGKILRGFRHRGSAAGEAALCPGGFSLPCSPQQPQSPLLFQRPSSLTPNQWGFVVLERPLATLSFTSLPICS